MLLRAAHGYLTLARWLARISAFILATALTLMALSVFIQIVLRSGFSTTWLALEDLVVYAFSISTFTGAALLFRERGHIAMPLVLERLPAQVAAPARLVSSVIIGLFLLGLVIYGVQFTLDGLGQFSPLLHIPVGWVNAVVPYTGAVGLVFLAEPFVENWVRGG